MASTCVLTTPLTHHDILHPALILKPGGISVRLCIVVPPAGPVDCYGGQSHELAVHLNDPVGERRNLDQALPPSESRCLSSGEGHHRHSRIKLFLVGFQARLHECFGHVTCVYFVPADPDSRRGVDGEVNHLHVSNRASVVQVHPDHDAASKLVEQRQGGPIPQELPPGSDKRRNDQSCS